MGGNFSLAKFAIIGHNCERCESILLNMKFIEKVLTKRIDTK